MWCEYWASLGLPGDFQHFDAEIAALPGGYQRLLVERVQGAAAGTVALRRLNDSACEMKRLYVRPAYRGCGLARKLIEEAIAEARSLGYTQVFCDTLPSMQAALALYKSLGFSETMPYSDNPTPGAIYLQRAI